MLSPPYAIALSPEIKLSRNNDSTRESMSYVTNKEGATPVLQILG